MQASRPISQPGATGVPLATGTTVTPPRALAQAARRSRRQLARAGLLKKPWLLAAIGGAIALVAMLGLLLARGGGGSPTAQPTSAPAVAVIPTETATQQPTSSPALNATAIRQTVQPK